MSLEKHYDTRTLSSATTSTWVPLNTRVGPFNTLVHVTLSAGANLTYTVEYTPEILLTVSDSVDAFALPDFEAVTATRAKAVIVPVNGVRLKVTSYTSGSAKLIVMQAGMG